MPVRQFTVLAACATPTQESWVRSALSSRSDALQVCKLTLETQAAIAAANPDLVILVSAALEGDAEPLVRAICQPSVVGEVAVIVAGAPGLKSLAKELKVAFASGDEADLLAQVERAVRPLLKVLVVDDEPTIRTLFRRFLQREGYTVEVARDGREALERVAASQPDLVLSDLIMPNLDGYGLCRAMRESRETRHIPVIVVSALGGELDVDKAFNAGTNEYLTKPVVLEELGSRIANIFRGLAMRSRECVLVVAPNQVERALLSDGLAKQGFEVLAARTLERGLVHLEERSPGLVICDDEAFSAEEGGVLREALDRHQAAVVLLTMRTADLGAKSRSLGHLDALVTKPFSIDRLVANIERIVAQRRARSEVERELLLQSVTALVTALEARDQYTRGHSENVAYYAVAIGEKMASQAKEYGGIDRLRLSARLHDIGKIGVPDAILLKPGRLTDAEMEVVKTHPGLGNDILAPIPSLQDILPGVRWHHERIDGRGYPDALPGSEIPLQARIISVADTFDALTSNRPYRSSRSVDEALVILREVRGAQLDAEVVDVFCTFVEANSTCMPHRSAPMLRAQQVVVEGSG